MITLLAINWLALLLSFFVIGCALGAAFSPTFRKALKTVVLVIARAPRELLFKRVASNPIITPGRTPWEAEAVMNPAAVVLSGRTHLIYRAIGSDGVSRLGYASSADGVFFDDRLPSPVYALTHPRGAIGRNRRYAPMLYPSGGSWGGLEDPRMVTIEGQVYVTFNVIENWEMRVAYISMSEKDFLTQHFDRWDGPTLLSHTNREKNWTLFPEKIGGKFAVLHGIIDTDENRVRIEYTDNLKTLSQRRFETIDPQKVPDKPIAWHVHVRSAGPPPLKTPQGWLVFYHAHDALEGGRYKLGAMLLDLDDPTRVTHRANFPVLSPDVHYENDGKPGIIYACGAVVRPSTELGTGDSILYLYYGGADKVVCVATAALEPFLQALISGLPAELYTQPAQTA